jgi:PGF-pre-PGF domain-containing protein
MINKGIFGITVPFLVVFLILEPFCFAGAHGSGPYSNGTYNIGYEENGNGNGNGGTGGGGGSSSTSITSGTSADITESISLATGGEAGETKKLTFSKDIGVTEVQLTLQNTVSKISVTVDKLSSKPAETTMPAGSVHSYLRIEKDLEDEDVEKVKIKFKVENLWLLSKGFSSEEIILKKYDRRWKTLPTRKISETGLFAYYEAETESFSYFAIVAEKKPAPVTAEAVEEVEEVEETPEELPEEPEEVPEEPRKKPDYILYVSIIGVIVIGLFLFLKREELVKMVKRKK